MNTSIFVLIMIFGGSTTQSGYTSVVQEFNSSELCESARKHLTSTAKAAPVRAQGCFKK